MLPVTVYCSNEASFMANDFHLDDSEDCLKVDLIQDTLIFVNIAGFKTMISLKKPFSFVPHQRHITMLNIHNICAIVFK